MASKRKASYPHEDEPPTKLRRYDSTARAGAAATPRQEVPFDWAFYQNDDTFLIDDIIHARCAWSTYWKAYMLHFARQTRSGRVSYVSFSTFEAHSILDYLQDIMKQIDDVENLGQPNQELIPFFKEKNPERPYEHEKNKWESFWKSPDLCLPSVRVRLAMNRISGSYNLFLNSPVSEEISKKNHGWQGPQLILPLASMRNMMEFMIVSIKRALHEPADE